MKIMWGGCSDAANLWASYKIHVKCLVDLQGLLLLSPLPHQWTFDRLVIELANRQELIPHAHINYGDLNTNAKQPINLEKAYKAYTEDAPLLQFKANQARHKKDYHVWAYRPIPEELLRYAAFDVASLRPIAAVFFKALRLWRWGAFEGATCRSRLTCEPRVRTCFTCLRYVLNWECRLSYSWKITWLLLYYETDSDGTKNKSGCI